MLAKRIIACLDVKDGRTVKGINFADIRDAGDPVELGRSYSRVGADELVYLDIAATVERSALRIDLIRRIAAAVDIPFTVGGGIGGLPSVEALLSAGADKITINSAAVRDPDLLSRIAGRFGSQCLVVAIDSRRIGGRHLVHVDGGRTCTYIETGEWARIAAESGAGEILLTSIDNDGRQGGFALDLTGAVAAASPIPVIASGGAGSTADFLGLFSNTSADAALAAGIFHFGAVDIRVLKRHLSRAGIPVRL